MRLQTVLLQAPQTAMEEMYYRKKDTTLTFNTYFNLFALAKWKKYTKLEQIYLRLRIIGAFRIRLICDEKCVLEKTERAEEEKAILLYFPERLQGERLWFELIDLSDAEDSKVLSGEYGTDVDEAALNFVKVGLDICTFHREDYVKRNVARIQKQQLDDGNTGLREHLKVFIVDNGKTLKGQIEESKEIHLIENRNLGGTGGFTRGLVEVLLRKEQECFTHVIFMDDDAELEADGLIRTFAFLRLLRTEYQNLIIGGAMLRTDHPYLEHAAGEYWNNGRLFNPKNGLDLRQWEMCVRNEEDIDCEYAGWWYCCLPLTVANERNLPFPLFIHLDDVEYGLRNSNSHILYLNGVCVWHAYFQHRKPSQFEYYEVRNGAMIRLLHPSGNELASLKKSLFRRITSNVLRYRYQDVVLNYKAIEDLCRGIDWFAALDGEAFHKQLLAQGYKIQKKEVLPHAQMPKVPMRSIPRKPYCSRKLLLYDPEDGSGFVVERSFSALIRSYQYYIKAVRLLNRHYHQLEKEYKAKSGYLMSLIFWKKYLAISSDSEGEKEYPYKLKSKKLP